MIQATLVGVLGQRLVRKICDHCREPFEIQAAELVRLGLEIGEEGVLELQRGLGCLRCRNTGYRGRTGIFEVLPYTEGLKRLTTAECDLEGISLQARREGMVTMRENAVKKMLSGVTTHQEVLRVTWEQ